MEKKVGPDVYQHWAWTVGRFDIGKTNDRGWRLQEFAKNHRLTLASILHPHTLSRTATWHALYGLVYNQIGFFLTTQWFKSSINKANTRYFPGADIGSDHDLVLTTIKLKLKTKRFTKNTCIRFDLEKLKDPKIAEMLQVTKGEELVALCVLDSDVDTLEKSLKVVLFSAAEVVNLLPLNFGSQTWFWICVTRDGS